MSRKFKHYTKAELEWLDRNYGELSLEECANFLGRSLDAVKNCACERGFSRRKIFSYNHEFKPNLEDPHFLYFLGFFWADGCLDNEYRGQLTLTIQEEDGLIIKDLIQKIDAFKERRYKKNNKKACISFINRNKSFCNFLHANDFLKKSFSEPSKILSLIKDEYHHLFWRGFFDGDGCITVTQGIRRINFAGQYSYEWQEASSLLNSLEIKFCISRTKTKYGNSSHLIFWRQSDVRRFVDYLYPNLYDFGLKRKYDKFIGSYKSRGNQDIPDFPIKKYPLDN